MFITVHAAASALIGKKVANPFISFVLALAMHFALDIIPHGDRDYGKRFFGLQFKKANEEEKFKRMAAYSLMDCLCLVFFLLYLFKNFAWARDDSVEWAIVGGVIPDFLVALYWLTKAKFLHGFFNFHHDNHNLLTEQINSDLPLKFGIMMQVILMSILLILIYTI